MRITSTLLAAAALVASAPAFATQGTAGSGVDNGTVDTTYAQPVQEEDDDRFPWGLLGLLGLAGLIPRKKAPPIHVDNRTTRP